MRQISTLSAVAVLTILLAGCPEFSSPPAFTNASDDTPPAFSNFAATPTFAALDTAVVLTFDATKRLPPEARDPKPNPEVTFAGVPMACTANGLSCRCETTVTDGLAEGIGHFEVVGTDAGGNESEPLDAPVTVTLDFTPPALTGSATPNPATKTQAITFTITSNEVLGEAPVVNAAFIAGTPVCSRSGESWTCNSAVSDDASTGDATFTVTGSDRAGNTATSDAVTVTLKDPPSSGAPTISFNGVSPPLAKVGDTLVITYSANQALTSCSALVSNATATCAPPVDTACACTFVVDANIADGLATITVNGTSATGTGVANGSVQIDKTPPTVDETKLTIARHPLGTNDGVFGIESGALDAGGAAYEDRKVVSVRLWNVASGGTPLASADVLVDGSFNEVAIPASDGGLNVSPASVWVSAIDLAGNESARVAISSGKGAPPVGAGDKLTIHRRDLTTQDGVDGASGAFVGVCALEGVSVFDVQSGGLPVGDSVVSGGGGFSEILVGSEDSAPQRLWVEATDKCGLVSARAEALVGADSTAPVVTGNRLVIHRRDFEATDSIEGLSGAIVDATSTLKTVSIFSAASGGAPIATLPVGTDGTFAELPVGSTTSAPARLYVEATDKCGNVSKRTEALVGRSLGITADRTQVVIQRRDLTKTDGVAGNPGAFNSACAYTVNIFTRASGGESLGTTAGGTDGAFDEVSIGTPTSSFKQAWAEAGDSKCSHPKVRVEALVGMDVTAPVVDATRLVIARRDFTAKDGLHGLAGALTDATSHLVSAEVYDQASGGELLGTLTFASDGGFEELLVGTNESSFANVYVRATDKAGNTSKRVAAGVGASQGTTPDATKMTITRRDLSARDGVSGGDGAFVDACAVEAGVFDAESNGNNLGTVIATSNGGFSEVLVGTNTSSYKRLWVEGRNKCGADVVRVEVLNGRDITAPVIDASRLTFFSKPANAPDELLGVAGAITDASPAKVTLRVFAAWEDDTPAATLLVGHDGGVAQTSIGEIHHPPYVDAVDKAGNVSDKALVGDLDWPQWAMPDSPTVFCTNGSEAAACPSPGEAHYGQDGNYRFDVPTYDSTTDTVTDTTTGLVWQRVVSTSKYTWAQARAYCDNLVLAEAFDWRLPTYIELFSIVDAGRHNPAIDTEAFPNTPTDLFWSSSPYVGQIPDGKPSHTTYARLVHFFRGDTEVGYNAPDTYRVRCVR